MEFGGIDIVLGMQWLCSLGSMEVNWKLLIMQYRMGETTITLKGDSRLNNSGISLKAMVKAQWEGQGIWLENILETKGKNHKKGRYLY